MSMHHTKSHSQTMKSFSSATSGSKRGMKLVMQSIHFINSFSSATSGSKRGIKLVMNNIHSKQEVSPLRQVGQKEE